MLYIYPTFYGLLTFPPHPFPVRSEQAHIFIICKTSNIRPQVGDKFAFLSSFGDLDYPCYHCLITSPRSRCFYVILQRMGPYYQISFWGKNLFLTIIGRLDFGQCVYRLLSSNFFHSSCFFFSSRLSPPSSLQLVRLHAIPRAPLNRRVIRTLRHTMGYEVLILR